MTIENIQEFRKKYPQYEKLSDQEVAKNLHDKYYSKIPYDQFTQKFGVKEEKKVSLVGAAITGLLHAPKNYLYGLTQNVLDGGNIADIAYNALPLPPAIKSIAQTGMQKTIEDNKIPEKAKDFYAQNEEDYRNAFSQHPNISNLYDSSGQVAAGLVAPLGKGVTIANDVGKGMLEKVLPTLKQMNVSGLINAGYGLAAGTPDNGSKLFNGLLGYATGAVLPGSFAAANKLSDVMSAPREAVARKVFDGIDDKQALETKAAAQRIKVDITPAEATGDPVAAAFQGKLGTSDEGARKLVKLGKKRIGQEKASIADLLNNISEDSAPAAADVRTIAQTLQRNSEAPIISATQSKVDDFLNSISTNTKDAGANTRAAANDIINKKHAALVNEVQPIYDAAYLHKVAPTKIKQLMNKDGTIETAINEVMNDPELRVELEGYAPNSIKVLDLAKQNIDTKIQKAMGTPIEPGNKFRVKYLKDSKERLLTAMDSYSDDYKLARQKYNEGAPAVQELRDSPIGKIADLDDIQLKNIGKIIFDSNETNPKVLAKIRDAISAKYPGLWENIVRNEMQRRLSKASKLEDEGDYHKALFKNPADIAQFNIATEKMPHANAKLNDIANNFNQLPSTLDQVRNTKISQLSGMSDDKLKDVSRIIFDPSQTDPRTLASLRDQFEKQDPKVWRRIVRNEFERRLDDTNAIGSQMHSKILKSDRSFNQFIVATKNIPGATQKLNDMRVVFKGLINPVTAKTAARLSKSSLDVPRSSTEAIANYLKNLFGGKYDNAAIDVISNPDWDKQMAEIRKVKDPQIKRQQMAQLLSRVASQNVVGNLNATTTEEEFLKRNPK